MPRINRILLDDGIYHVINRGNAKREIFLKQQDYQVFFDLMKKSKKDFGIKLFAYCLMPNHFHFVLQPSRAEGLSQWIRWLMTAHVRRYHKHYGGSGHIWQGRYRSFLIQQDEYLLTALRYVEANPLRAHLVSSAHLWPWSSHLQRIGNSVNELLDDPPIEIPKEWIAWVNQVMKEDELVNIRTSVNRQSPYGAGKWREAMIERFGLYSTVRLVGRPRKKRDRHNFRVNGDCPHF